MGTYIVLAILAAVVVFAVFGSVKHFKGEGGCCGGGTEVKENKKLKGNITAKRTVHIDGMRCEHCKNAVERQINRIDGAAAKVNLKKNIAVVAMERDVADEEIVAAVERAGFKVKNIEY